MTIGHCLPMSNRSRRKRRFGRSGHLATEWLTIPPSPSKAEREIMKHALSVVSTGLLAVAMGCASTPPTTLQTGPEAEVTIDGLTRVDNSLMTLAYVEPDNDAVAYELAGSAAVFRGDYKLMRNKAKSYDQSPIVRYQDVSVHVRRPAGGRAARVSDRSMV